MNHIEKIAQSIKIESARTGEGLYDLDNCWISALSEYAISSGQIIYSRNKKGFLSGKVLDLINSIGPFKLSIDSDSYTTYISESSVLTNLSKDEGDVVNLFLYSISESETKKFEEECDKFITKQKKNKINVLTAGMDGFYLTSIGAVNEPLIRDNYTDEVLKSFDFVSSDFNSSNPSGRLVIINGPAGTGKTYFVRGLIDKLEDTTIVLIPAKMIDDIDGPSLVSTFVEHKRKSKKSMTLIIEDADACLAPRMNDNISAISSLLNHTDGILGAILDLKVIATTNQGNMEFDSALIRAGRLSRHIEVGLLEADKANAIYHRLNHTDEDIYTKPTTLADVYSHAKKDEQKELNIDPGEKLRKRTNKIGFGS